MRWNYKYPTSKKSKFADVAINCMFKVSIQVYFKEMKPVHINCPSIIHDRGQFVA